jgi:peptidoglycan/LPS O-acetylase OafA/YrhL
MLPLSHPESNDTRPIHPGRQPEDAPASGPPRPAAGQVSRLDRVTLQLGVAVAVVIAICSYAVSATSLYALGIQAGYSWWQAAAVPVVADGPAIYGMFRIISRSRRNANGAGYGWLLVIAGTLASIGGNVAHAHPNLVARAIAAAIPLAVLAMLEGLKGDAGEGHPPSRPYGCGGRRWQARAGRSAPAGHNRSA